MSVVSGTRQTFSGNTPTLGRNGGAAVFSYETMSNAGHKDASSVKSTAPTKQLPSNAVTVPSTQGKLRLLGDNEMTEEELEHLAEVCRRCEMLQRQEDDRIKGIREKALEKEKSRRGITMFDDEHCAVCSAAFLKIFSPKSTCIQCGRNVCRNCINRRIEADTVLCTSCFSECTNKARTGLWFTERLQMAKREGRVIPLAPTSALRASVNRKKREQSAASSVVGFVGRDNNRSTDIAAEALQRLASEVEKTSSLAQKPPLPRDISLPSANQGTIADQLVFNMAFAGVDDLPKSTPRARSRQHSSSGYSTTNTATGAYSAYDGNNWDNRSMISAVSMGSVTSIYSEREESFTHGINVTGDISFSVDYDDKSQSLRVYVKQCREIAAADKRSGNSTTYVKSYLLPDKAKDSKRKTKVKKNTINPVFNEPLIYNIQRSDLAYRTLQLSVWHHRHMKANLFLGEVLVNLADYRFSSTPIWRALQTRSTVELQSGLHLTKGQLTVGLKFLPGPNAETGQLHVLVRGASNLNVPTGVQVAEDGKNSINAYVKIRLLPDRSKESKRTTQVIKKSQNPSWEETIVYDDIPKTQLPSLGLELVVWDHMRVKNDEFLGGCNLNTGSRGGYGMDATGNERALWVEMMSKPNTMVEATVNLRSSMD